MATAAARALLEHGPCPLPVLVPIPLREHAAPGQFGLRLGEPHVAPVAQLLGLREVALCLVVPAENGEEPAEEARHRLVHREPLERDLLVVGCDEQDEVLGGRRASSSIATRAYTEMASNQAVSGSTRANPSSAACSSRVERLCSSPASRWLSARQAWYAAMRGFCSATSATRDCELVQPALLDADDHQLCPVEGEGVGLRAVGADLEGQVGQLLRPLVVAPTSASAASW